MSKKKDIEEIRALRSRKAKLERVSRDTSERKRVEKVLQYSKEEWENTFNAISDWVVLVDLEGLILQTNRIGEEFTGVPLDEIVGQSCCRLVHGSDKHLPGCPLLKMLETGQREAAELKVPDTDQWLIVTVDPVTDEEGKIIGAVHITRDITERKRAEEVKKLSSRLLEIANRHTRKIALLKELVAEIQDFTGCAAVGIRMLDEQGNIPYEAYVGFSREFYESESPLSTKTDKCMCINVIKRDTDPEQPFYTKGGSFYMNGTTKFLATVSEEDKGQTRNVCNEVGYESVALVPIHVDNSIIGLIHIADTQENMAPLHTVEALEYVAVHLGTAILRVCAEEALRESEAELFTVLNNIPSVLIVVDRDRRVHRLNKSAVEFGRRTAEEMIGLRGGEALRCLHSLDDPKGCGYGPFCEICVVRNTVLETFKTGKSFYQREAQLPFDIDGKIEELALLVSTTTVEISGSTMVLVCLENITKRKRAEEQIENLAKFPSENPYPIVRIAADGTVLYANQVSNTLLAERKSGAGQLCPSDWRGMVSDVLKSGSVKRIEVRHKGRTFAFRIVPVQDANYVNFYGTDITERKRAEEAMKIRAEILENMVEGVNVSDDNGIIFFTNPKFDSMFGYEPGELTGQNVSILNALPEEENAKLVNVIIGQLRAKGGWRGELTNRRKDGTQFFTHAKISQLYMSGKNHWISVQEDITERKKAEERLLEYQAQLKSLASELTLTEERERHRIAADLHDQISQSLVISKIKLDTLRSSALSEDLAKELNEIGDLLYQTVQDIQSLTFDLSFPVLYELGFEAAVAAWLAEQIQEKQGIASEFEDDEQPKPLDDDVRVLLFRDVRELLVNVVRHANAKKVKVSIRKVGSEIHARVEDNGVGFDVAKVVSTSAVAGGFGFFSIRERLEELGGHLEIDSEPGHGTRVTLMAPLKQQNTKGRQK